MTKIRALTQVSRLNNKARLKKILILNYGLCFYKEKISSLTIANNIRDHLILELAEI